MIDSNIYESEDRQFDFDEVDIDDKTDELDLKKFRELLMQENINIVAKLRKYKTLDFRRKLVIKQLNELKRLSELSKIWVSVPFHDQSFNYPVISVDSSKAGSNTDVLRLAINDLGWKEYPNGRSHKSCHVIWNSCNFNENKSNTGAFVNKFPGISQCLHKVGFTRILETMRTLFPEHYSFYPQTWYLPHQMVEFVIYCKNRESENKKEMYYIVKPDAGTQGEGIYLIKRPEHYKPSSKNFVVQEYLSDPVLLDGYKFDLRLYVLLLGLDPLKVYICNEGLARFCTDKYSHPTATNHGNTFMHLTNYSLNKKSNQFIHTQNLDSGSKRTMSSVFAALESNGCDVGCIWKKLEELVYKTVLAMVPQLKVHYATEILGKMDDMNLKSDSTDRASRPNCFQILGFDILIMEDLQPYLLEVNSNPSLRMDCEMEIAPGISEYYLSKVDIGIKRPLVKDTLKLLEKDISDKFKIEIRDQEDCDWLQRANDLVPVDKERSFHKSPGDDTEMENFEELITEWNIDSEFGPHFLEIAKQNNSLPRSNSIENIPNENVILEANARVVGTSTIMSKEQIQRLRERLAKEKSWLNASENVENESNDNNRNIKSTAPREKSAKSRSDYDLEETSCLNLISSKSYKSIYDKLRILEETTVIFFHAMGCRYTGNMGATAFRTFGRRCNLHQLGFNHAMIDLIFIEVQRRWSFLLNYESKQGLCYQAFLEAFFRISFAKFTNQSKRDAVQSLIEHCKRSIGPENFKWTKTLFPTNDTTLPEKSDIRRNIRPLASNNESVSIKSQSNDRLDSVTKKRQESPAQSKYELIKSIHQIYKRKLRIPQSSILKDVSNSDTDSVNSSPSTGTNRNKPRKNISKYQLVYGKESRSMMSDKRDSNVRTYRYDSPVRHFIRDMPKKSTFLSINQEHSTVKIPSEKNENVRYVKNLSNSKDQAKKLPSINVANSTKELFLPMNNERMMMIISAYGGHSLLKSPISRVRRRLETLKSNI